MENESGQIYRELLRNAGEDKYSALSDLVVGMTRIVYGVVIQFSKPRKSSGTDSVVNLILTDPTMPKIADGMVMNFFHPNLWMLPRPEAVGDVIVCAIKIQKYRDKLQGISLKKEYMVHIISKDVADPIASHLREWWTSANAPRADDGVIAYFGRPTLEIKDIKVPNTFCDLVGKVVHCFPYVIGPPSRLQILITDFTENTDISCPLEMSFMPYIDPQYAPKTILSITLWESNAEYSQGLEPGNIVHLRNIRIRHGTYGIEGIMHGDPLHNTRLNVTVLAPDDPSVLMIQERENDYIACLSLENPNLDTLPAPLEIQPVARNVSSAVFTNDGQSNTNRFIDIVNESIAQTVQPDLSIPVLRPKVESTRLDNLPAANYAKAHVSVRVLDHLPENVMDFPQRMPDGAWRWNFTLLVEDEAGQCEHIKVLSETGERFLNTLPMDFTQDSRGFAVFQRQLRRLWKPGPPGDIRRVYEGKMFHCQIERQLPDAPEFVVARWRLMSEPKS